MELRICDLRNAKFQGQTVNKVPAGFGFLLDQNYSFIVSHIYNGILSGPSAIVFGDSNKLCLDFDRSDGLTVYTNKYFKIYKNKKNLVINFTASKILIKVEQTKNNQQTQQYRSKNSKPQPKIKIIDQKKYTNESYSNILAKFLGVSQIQPKQSNFLTFVKQNFKQKYRNLMNISQTSKQFAYSFRGVGLFLKMIKCQVLQHHFDKISTVGFNSAEKNPQIYRRYSYFRDYTDCLVQQSIETQPAISVEFQICEKNCKDRNTILGATLDLDSAKQNRIYRESRLKQKQQKSPSGTKQQHIRPKQCIKNLREYYKRSLTFINSYINLSKIYELKQYFDQISLYANQLDGGKYAQTQIQINGYQVDQYQNPIITRQNQVRPVQATLDDWKKQLSKTIGKDRNYKKTNRSGSPTNYDDSRRINLFNLTPQKYKQSQYLDKDKQNYKDIQLSRSRQRSRQRQRQRQRQERQRQRERERQRQKEMYQQNQKRPQPYRRTNPERQPKKQYIERNQRSKSQKPLKYLDSQPEQRNSYNEQTKRYVESSSRYPNLLTSYKKQPQPRNTKNRSPFNKFKYTQQQKQSDRYQNKYTGKREYIGSSQPNIPYRQLNTPYRQLNTPSKNLPNQRSSSKYPIRNYSYNNQL